MKVVLKCGVQVFANCVHSYNRVRNVHANGVYACVKFFVRGIDSSV